MKKVELAQIRAMSREIVATSGNNGTDVGIVMALGSAEKSNPTTSINELNRMLAAVEQALPGMKRGLVGVTDDEWQEFETLYYNRVVQPLFA